MLGLKILKTGSYLPDKVMTNEDFTKFIETSDEWIQSRTGVRERRYAEDMSNMDMAYETAKKIMEGVNPEEIGGIIVATFTPDYQTPSVSCMLQGRLGLSNDVFAMDVNAACAGFIYGLYIARGILLQNPNKKILLLGSEKISPYMDFTDRNTCILFGDGTGGALLGLQENSKSAFTFQTFSDDESIICKRGEGDYIQMNGKEVFLFGVNAMLTGIERVLSEAQLEVSDIDHFVCHQANIRMIQHVYKKLDVDASKFYVNLDRCGNTSSASIPLVLDEMNNKGLLKEGEKLVLVGFGAGLTWGATLINW